MITVEDAGRLLAAIAAYDKRTTGGVDARAWAAAINHAYPTLRVDDALAAIIAWHATTTDGWMRPAHLIAETRQVARRRAGAERSRRHATGCYGIVADYGADAAAQVRALPAAPTATITTGQQRARDLIAQLAARRAMPDLDDMDPSEQIRHRAIQRAQGERRDRRRGAA